MPVTSKAERPRVLHIGYQFDPSEVGRGGVIVYQWAMMRAAVRAGWDVSFFMAAKHTLSKKVKIKTCNNEGVKIIELINSPRRHLDFSCDPLDHLSNQLIETVTEQVLDEERPDIVHIHDPRLLTASIVDTIRKKQIPAMKTVHNYFDLCPQGELMFKGRTVCSDYHEGSRCVECMSSLPVESFMKERISNTLRGTFMHPALKRTWRFINKFRNDSGNSGTALLPFPPDSYRNRRRYCVERLQMLSTVHCYSRRSAEILVQHGVDEKKISLVPISSDSIRGIKPKPLRADGYPVVFGYLTGASYLKGYEVILDAFSRLDQQKAKLIAYGFDEPKRFRDKFRHLNAEFHSSYHPARLNEVLSSIDIGLVPSLWEEVFGIVGIEFLSARAPVIGSNIGGIPEWLRDGENGFLTKAGDSQDLSGKMKMFVDSPELISRLQNAIAPWKSMETHAQEMLALYQKIL